MISLRCKILVKTELEKLGIECVSVDLGVVETLEEISDEEIEELRHNLSKSGLELQKDKKSALICQIEEVIMELIQNSDGTVGMNYSEYLSQKLNQEYNYLSNLFSEMKGITIQKFIVNYRIEHVKELLSNSELSLTDIAYKLNYSSVAHLSNQFKKNTGFSPSTYRQMIAEKVWDNGPMA